jgi:hypothetical protein
MRKTKRRWIPKKNEYYWLVVLSFSKYKNPEFKFVMNKWCLKYMDFYHYVNGNCFKTKAEAQKATRKL